MKPAAYILLALPLLLPAAEPVKGLLRLEGFDSLEIGSEPDNVLALNGEFTVQQESEKNKALALPGAPLETMTLLLEPSRGQGVSIRASIKSEKTGRREPSFGVGLGGAVGYRLVLSPQRDTLELFLDEQAVAKVDYKWVSGSWTVMELSVTADEDRTWRVRGKAWDKAGAEPADWSVVWTAKEQPPTGQASLWGMPYSGKTIWYDDVEYREVGE